MKHEPQGYYCKICGARKANERFSGKEHAAHICKDCEKLPTDVRSSMQIIRRIENLPPFLTRNQRSWLAKMTNDQRKGVRDAAYWAFVSRYRS